MSAGFVAERAISPVDGRVSFVVVDDEYALHAEACEFLAYLRAAGRSPNTERVYASRVATFLNYCARAGLDWRELSFDDLSRFMTSLVTDPLPTVPGRAREPRFRSNATANAIMTATCEYLRFGASRGWVARALIDRLSKPKYLRHRALGYDWGEDEQFRTVSARLLKLTESGGAIQRLAVDEVAALLDMAGNRRDRFLISLMNETGMRIGETLGLRREDTHFLSSSSRLGCSVAGPHVHVRRRMNVNGALAKSRFPRTIPVTEDVVGLYAAYQHERATTPGADGSDFVFVNLFKPPIGEPMKYSNAKKLFDRLSAATGVTARPHMLRHSAATRWLDRGTPRDVVQALLGHVSPGSMEVYLHPTDEAMRAAVERTGAPR
ncbi:tyrosine-type recombinase/integrase [Rhodococcus hoagii]|nr:tyrosine-type recombinase/integrase [Prescottella equi]MBM4650319.1 tyrosine-type recombinase/integrase [Prescottella equi]MBM4683429.1 tyrosine-type recombinase/integrase [Prescottella equi]